MLVDIQKYIETLPESMPIIELHNLIDGFLSQYDYK